jgi:hypothetical protein
VPEESIFGPVDERTSLVPCPTFPAVETAATPATADDEKKDGKM